MGLLMSRNLCAQTEHKCYYLENNSDGQAERVFVELLIEGTQVNVNYKKYSEASTAYFVNIKREGILQGDKIIFPTNRNLQDGNVSEPGRNDYWLLQNDSLIVEKEILKSGSCQ